MLQAGNDYRVDCSNVASVARNVFEKGLEDPRVFREPAYILEYQSFLCSEWGGRGAQR